MIGLDLSPRFEDADTFYKNLIDAIDSAGEERGVSLLVRLALILANQVGDQAILKEAVARAAQAIEVENSSASA